MICQVVEEESTGGLAPEPVLLSPAHPKVWLLSPRQGSPPPPNFPLQTQDTFTFPALPYPSGSELEPFNCLRVKAQGSEQWDSPQTAPRQHGSSVGRSRATSPKRGQVSGRGPGQSRSTGTMVS